MVERSDVVLVGHGVVGQATAGVLVVGHDVHDPARDETVEGRARTAIVCTPCLDGTIDCTKELAGLEPEQIVVRSTVKPYALMNLRAQFPKALIWHWPEWLTARTANQDAANPDKVVFGLMRREDAPAVAKRMVELVGAEWMVPWLMVDFQASCLAKIAVNTYGALKTWLFNALYEAADDDRVYSEMIAVIAQDQRVHLSHHRPWTGGYLGFSGFCLPKDMGMLADMLSPRDASVLSAVLEANALRLERQ